MKGSESPSCGPAPDQLRNQPQGNPAKERGEPEPAPGPPLVNVWRVQDGAMELHADQLAIEEPLEIRVNGQPLTVTMRTPGHDGELAAGLLLAEGVLKQRKDIRQLRHCPQDGNGNRLEVELAPHCVLTPAQLHRQGYTNSACGVCGKASIDAMHDQFQALAAPVTGAGFVSFALLARLPDLLARAQSDFHRTGATHGAALFDRHGNLRVIREDVGRHNAVDKVMGHALLRGWLPLRDSILLVSGRVAFEIIHKALAGGVPLIAAVSGPTSLAVRFAQENNQTLVGFVRDGRMNVYTHPERLGIGQTTDS